MKVNKLHEGLDCETNDEEDDWNEAPREGTRSGIDVLLEHYALAQGNDCDKITEGTLDQAVKDSESLENESYNDSVSVQNESADVTILGNGTMMHWEENFSDTDIELGKTKL